MDEWSEAGMKDWESLAWEGEKRGFMALFAQSRSVG